LDLVPHDFESINLDVAGEIAYWCANFRCTGSELRAAVAAVGSSSKAVAQHLRSLAGRPTADESTRFGLNERSNVRDVVESMLCTLLPPRYEHRVRELLGRAMAHADIAPHENKRWVTLSIGETATIARAVATIVDEARMDERRGRGK